MRSSFRSIRTALAATGTFTVLFTALGGGLARGGPIHQPIEMSLTSPILPGEPVDCAYELTGGPANITVYSDPPGVVSYQGTVSEADGVVTLSTDPAAEPGPVTVYLTTDGSRVMETDGQVMESEGAVLETEEPVQ